MKKENICFVQQKHEYAYFTSVFPRAVVSFTIDLQAAFAPCSRFTLLLLAHSI